MTERDRYTNEEKEAEPKEVPKEASIVEKIQQLGQTNVPQYHKIQKFIAYRLLDKLKVIFSFHHKIKQQNMNISFHN